MATPSNNPDFPALNTRSQTLQIQNSSSSDSDTDSSDDTIIVPRQTMAEPMIKPKTFQGRVDEDAKHWLFLFEKFVTVIGYNDEQAAAAFGHFLDNSAEVWYKGLPTATKNDIALLKADFAASFKSNEDIWQKERKNFKVEQGNKNVRDYIMYAREQSSHLDISEEQACRTIAGGLQPATRAHVLQHDHKTFKNLMKEAIFMENIVGPSQSEILSKLDKIEHQMMANMSVIPKKVVFASSADRRSPSPGPFSRRQQQYQPSYRPWNKQGRSQGRARSYQCHRCGKFNPQHSPSQCFAKSLTCQNCRKLGHIAKICMSPRQNTPNHYKQY